MVDFKRILIIEENEEISKLLHLTLEKAGYDTTFAYSGTEGLFQLQNNPFDLILLGLMLPGKREDLIKDIRKESSIPIIVISAKVNIEDKVHVLNLGADNYITKPFDHKEVLARIEIQLRKSHTYHSTQPNEIVWRGIKINLDEHSVTLNDQELLLTNAEFDILALLASHPERAFSKQEIYEKIWKDTYVGDDNTISVHISNIRKKMATITSEEYIKTIWGVGFMMI